MKKGSIFCVKLSYDTLPALMNLYWNSQRESLSTIEAAVNADIYAQIAGQLDNTQED